MPQDARPKEVIHCTNNIPQKYLWGGYNMIGTKPPSTLTKPTATNFQQLSLYTRFISQGKMQVLGCSQIRIDPKKLEIRSVIGLSNGSSTSSLPALEKTIGIPWLINCISRLWNGMKDFWRIGAPVKLSYPPDLLKCFILTKWQKQFQCACVQVCLDICIYKHVYIHMIHANIHILYRTHIFEKDKQSYLCMIQ